MIPTHVLVPCPFCGAEMVEYTGSACFFHPGTITEPGCLLNGRGFNRSDAEAWNSRAAPRAPYDVDALVERLRAVIEIAHRDSNLVDSQFSVTTEDYRATEAERDEAQVVLEFVATRLSAEQIAENANCSPDHIGAIGMELFAQDAKKSSARERALEEAAGEFVSLLTNYGRNRENVLSIDHDALRDAVSRTIALLDAKEG